MRPSALQASISPWHALLPSGQPNLDMRSVQAPRDTSTRNLRSESQKRIEVDLYTLSPRAFVLAWTAERISIPINSRLAARVEGKSSLARLGWHCASTSTGEGQSNVHSAKSSSTRACVFASVRSSSKLVRTPERGLSASPSASRAPRRKHPSQGQAPTIGALGTGSIALRAELPMLIRLTWGHP